jgi:hypothetical protein
MVKLPWEKAHSTLVDVPACMMSHVQYIIYRLVNGLPGIDRKFFTIGAKGCLLAAMAVQYCKPLVIFEIRGVLSHSLTASPVDTVLNALKVSKYLFRDDEAYKDWNELCILCIDAYRI